LPSTAFSHLKHYAPGCIALQIPINVATSRRPVADKDWKKWVATTSSR
ncbi:1261_t:CDS:1, partial [Acaulospora colombiana]